MQDFFLYIHTLRALPHFPRLDCIGKETRSSAAYRVEGCWRRDSPRVIFQYSLEGEGIFEDKRGAHRVGPGHGFLCEAHDPGMTYYFPPENTDPWHFLFVDLLGAAAHAMAGDLIRQFGGVYPLARDHIVIRKLLSFHVYHDVGCTLSLAESTRLATDLLNALTASKTAIQEQHGDHILISRFQEILQAEIGSPLTVGELAERLSVSAEHLARVFKQHTGTPPHAHIQHAKMLAACGMLKASTLSVKEIAFRVGFETAASFARTFRRVVGCTPVQFRRSGVMPARFGPPDSPRRPKQST